jgi:transcriptional regulator of acetoin/glycerol metabolism
MRGRRSELSTGRPSPGDVGLPLRLRRRDRDRELAFEKGAFLGAALIQQKFGVTERVDDVFRAAVVADLGSLARGAARSAAGRSDDLPSLNLIDLERMAIERALVRTEWHQGEAAEILGVSARTLHRKIREYALKRPE